MFFAPDERIEQRGLLPAVPIRIIGLKAVPITGQPLPELGQARDRLGIHAGPGTGETDRFAHQPDRRFASGRQRGKDRDRHFLVIDPFHSEARRPSRQAQRTRAFFIDPIRNVDHEMHRTSHREYAQGTRRRVRN